MADEKKSAWDDAPRVEPDPETPAPDPELTGLDIAPGVPLTPEQVAALPPWVPVLRPGRVIIANGWVTRVVLVDPSRGFVMLHVEGPTQSKLKAVARAERGLKPKHVQRKQKRKRG